MKLSNVIGCVFAFLGALYDRPDGFGVVSRRHGQA